MKSLSLFAFPERTLNLETIPGITRTTRPFTRCAFFDFVAWDEIEPSGFPLAFKSPKSTYSMQVDKPYDEQFWNPKAKPYKHLWDLPRHLLEAHQRVPHTLTATHQGNLSTRLLEGLNTMPNIGETQRKSPPQPRMKCNFNKFILRMNDIEHSSVRPNPYTDPLLKSSPTNERT